MKRTLASSCALIASCSLAVKGPPAQNAAVLDTDCTDTYLLPTVDVVLFAASVAFAAIGVRRGGDCEALDCLQAPIGIAAAIAFTFSAADGFDKVHRCRQYRAASTAQS